MNTTPSLKLSFVSPWLCFLVLARRFTLPETNIAPETWMVGVLVSSSGWPIFRCELLVSGRICVRLSVCLLPLVAVS